MTKKKILLLLFIIGNIFLCACSGKTSVESVGAEATQDHLTSPEHTAENVMNSLRTLDLDTFNEYTDNYISTTRNWIGIPTSAQYRVFNELLQPTLIKGKHYKRNYQLSQKLTQNLSWEITQVRESDQTAEIDMDITNLDMSLATGNYMVFLLENMSQSNGIGLRSLMKDMRDLNQDMDGFLSIIDSLDSDDTCTISVTLSAFKQDGKWKLHVSDEFINAFMGNIDSEEYPEEIMQKINVLEKEIEDNTAKWAEDFESRMEGLFD
ncbi:hypothetical protein [Parablautia muri]|uniref:Lipoprotein n=1 Tax=Parablautia muri TaxID=2320879 RepID=A0A9X5BHE6_9FIRM|nr:hypothetical protein [Parablautia muri]NBJ94110.1 hypothetical protein [Parablautia muri]